MRKMKKINGYLVVRFNDRELREYEGTALGEYGVIDAELYSGCLDVDRGAMAYDDAGSLEEAVELARGLNAEEDYTGLPETCTVIRENDRDTEMNQVDPQLMIEGWTEELTQQVNNRHYPDIDARTAAHELYGYKMALARMGLIDADEAYVLPNTFEAATAPVVATNAAHPFDFLHQLSAAPTWRLYELGRALEKDIVAKVQWTPKATQYLENKEYRYISPVVNVRKSDKKAMGLHSLALTNTPAIEDMKPIVNSANFEGGQNPMDELMQKIAQLLGLGADATPDQIIEALTAALNDAKALKDAAAKETHPATDDKVVANKAVCELLDLKAGAAADDVAAKIMELKSGKIGGTNVLEELKALKQHNAERAADDAVILALKSGKITPAQQDWARSYALSDPKGFGSFVEKAPQIVPLGEIGIGDVKALKSDTLDEATLLACKQLGVSAEDAQKFGLG